MATRHQKTPKDTDTQTVIHLKLTPTMHGSLRSRAKKEHRKKTDLIRIYIERGLAQREASL